MFTWKKNLACAAARMDGIFEKFVCRHRAIGFLAVFVGAPLFALAAVCASTTVIVLPLALAMGWV